MTDGTIGDELHDVLAELRRDPRNPLRGHGQIGDPAGGPWRVSLAAWAVDIADTIHSLFGSFVNVEVGFLSFPNRGRTRRAEMPGRPPTLSSNEIDVRLDHPCKVASGHDLRAMVLVHNRGLESIDVRTNGHLTATVLDVTSGEVVGGYAGAQTLPLVMFHAAPGEVVEIPVLIGTASLEPSLGYAVPPGEWQLDVVLDIDQRGRYRSMPLPMSVTS